MGTGVAGRPVHNLTGLYRKRGTLNHGVRSWQILHNQKIGVTKLSR
jgi:hypothetical protein